MHNVSMEENLYSSLEEKLIQSGIIKQGNEQENIFYNTSEQEGFETGYHVDIPEDFQNHNVFGSKKRLNEYDLNLLKEKIEQDSPRSFQAVKRLLSVKENKISKANSFSLERLFFIFFPKIYKAKIAKDALKKLGELNIDTKALLDKTIPYGEEEIRYKNLIKYLNFANEIQNTVKRKCD